MNATASADATYPRVVVIDWATAPDSTGNGWIVDIRDAGLFDTSSRWFAREEEARFFAGEVGALLILPVVDEVDDADGLFVAPPTFTEAERAEAMAAGHEAIGRAVK